jgi:hypothetical protein
MSFGEGTAGSRFQIPLEPQRPPFLDEVYDHVNPPRAMPCGVRASARIVVTQSSAYVRGDTHIEVGHSAALENVNEPLVAHVPARCNDDARMEITETGLKTLRDEETR